MIVTFYSFKGGVGRSMALANVGEILADWGYRVILCDWDLEAPGLERYFSPVESPWFGDPSARESYDRYYKEMLAHEGLMELLSDYKQTLTRTPAEGETPAAGQPDSVSVGKLMLRRPSASAYVPPTRLNDDRLRILSAGRRENEEQLRQYAEVVRDFDWTEFYEKWAGNAYIEFFRKELKGEHGGDRAKADIVLVDSRTGVTEQGGVCTHHLADLVVLTTAPNEANVDGAAWMASSLTRNEKLEAMRGGRSLAVLPVISRVEVFNERELYDDFEEYFVGKLTPYLPKAITEGPEFFRESRIPYATFYSFRERVVARETKERRQRELYRAYTQLAYAVVRHGLAAGILAEDHTPTELRRATMPHAERPRRTLRGPVFISHSAEDSEVAAMVADALRRRGVQEVLPALPIGVGITADAAQSILPEAGTVFFVVGENGMSESMRAELDFIVHQTANGKQTTIVTLLTNSKVFPSPLLVGYRSFVLPPDAQSNTEFFDDLITEASTAPAPAIVGEDAKPYPGMAPFRESDARFFCGRDTEIADIENAMADAAASSVRWLRVEGASGIGVSSIVNAGLIPAIRRGAVHGIGRDATVAICSAAAIDPLLSLASALAIAPAVRVEEVQAHLDKPDLVKYAVLLLRGWPAVLVIESLDTMGNTEASNVFCTVIATLLEAEELPLTVVSTARSGTVTKLADTKLAVLAHKAKVFELLPIDGKRLREVVVAPSTLAGMAFETGLPERIVGEALATMNCPSFLASQLQYLWKTAKGRGSTLITHAMYEDTGDMFRLTVEIAEEALRSFRGEDREIAQSILIRLVSGVETRLSRAVVALVAGPEGEKTRERILTRLADARLLTRRVNNDGEEEAELSHDAVLEAPTMARWIDDERVKIRQRSELELAARSWKKANKPSGGLPTGGQLRYFEKVETTSPEVVEFLASARRFTLLRRIGFTAVTIFGALVLWWWIRSPSEPATPASRNDFADFLASGFQDNSISFSNGLYGLLESALRFKGADAEHTNRLLRAALKASVAPQAYTTNGAIVSFDLSNDGRVLAIAQSDQIEIYDVTKHELIGKLTSQGTLVRASLNSDGSLLFIHHSDRLPEVWHVRPVKQVWYVPKSLYQTGSDAMMSRDGRRVAMLDPSGVLRIFPIPGGTPITSRSRVRIVYRPDATQSLAFAPGGNRIVAFGRQGSLYAWNARGELIVSLIAHETRIERFAFSSDGRQMATYTPGRLMVWDLEGGKMMQQVGPTVLPQQTGGVVGVAMSPEGAPQVLAYADGTLFFNDYPGILGRDMTIGVPAPPGKVLSSIESVPGNRFIVAGQGTLEVWSASGDPIRKFALGDTDAVTQLSVGGSRHAIVAGELDTSVALRVWDIDAMLTYTATNIPDSQLRTLAEQRLKELSVKATPTPSPPNASTARSPETAR